MQYLSFIKRCHVFLHFHCFVVSVRHIVLYFSVQYPLTLFITYFELLQRYIYIFHMDCLYMFISVHILQFGIKYMYVHLKSSFNVFWYKMYTRIYIVRNLHIITFGGEGIFIQFQKSRSVKKKGGGCRRVGQLLTGFKRILHVLIHTRAVVGS